MNVISECKKVCFSGIITIKKQEISIVKDISRNVNGGAAL